jgi:hypothetical protein
MRDFPLCAICGAAIGVYEPIVVIDAEVLRQSSLAKESDLGDETLVHRACMDEVGLDPHALAAYAR